MNIRPFLTLLLLASLAACSGQDAAPQDSQPAPPATEAPDGGEAAAPAAPAPAAPSGPAPVAGVDYQVIENGQPFQPVAGKIEVAEVFGYTCPHCANFDPILEAWAKRQPADVNLVLVPGAFGGYWTPYARAFYTAEALGVLPKTHAATFRAIHLERSLPVNANVGAAELAPFYAQYGVDAKRFADTFNSFGVEAKLNRARQFAARARIEGTPALVVAGKYTINADQYGFEKMLATAEWLVAQERGGAR
ncbi:thiol:disulfide interchange protein DsbA/DsbL [Pseudoxanthomonas taiwanensis]|uniref:Thiol:disulfide interchange protein DsbA n=1 Tax=Pseudoxanthomonas taiwanensis J19 TaxID=935569 RepID=A0A562E498_9GAMM|nr:thiol:disulfide interchange protein DsbA/DsbL [Pseudoxanthomonas taiwanensis]TWH16866.1 thiol:disulfide interchange protein DsbA [Pseudoxanthomonas taiwanensis J19]